MFKSRILFAFAVALAATTMVQSAQAGCGGGRHYVSRSYRAPVVHRTIVHRPVIHQPVVVHRPVVVHKPVVIHKPIVAPQCPSVPAGSKLTLPANFLGPNPGHVFLSVEGTKLPCQVIDWKNDAVTFQMPPMAVVKPLHAALDIILPHGQLAKRTKILLIAPPQLFVHDTGPQAPLPTLAGPAIKVQAPQGPNQILLPTQRATPAPSATPGPIATPAPNGQAGIPFAPQAGPAPFTVLPQSSTSTGASASLLDAIANSDK